VAPLQAVQIRSTIAEPACIWPWPIGQVAHAVQTPFPAAVLKVPAEHTVQTRSEDGPGAAVSYCPAWHSLMSRHTRSAIPVGAANVYWPPVQSLWVLQPRSVVAVGAACSHSFPVHTVTGAQALPLSADEYVDPLMQGAHSRSATAVPALDMPEPAGHVDHSVHAIMPLLAVKVPEPQSAHARSLLTVASAVVYAPATHGALTALHGESAPENDSGGIPNPFQTNVLPNTQGVHRRSAVAEPALDMPEPAGQVDHSVHAIMPLLAVKVPEPQSAHVRSLLVVARAVVNLPAAHGALTQVHAVSPPPEKVDPSTHTAHCRFSVADPACTTPEPAGQVDQVVQDPWPAEDANDPSWHGVHVRSLLAVAAAVVNEPGAHGWLTATQGSTPPDTEYATPTLQASQALSSVVDPVTHPNPGEQTAQLVQAPLPWVALKVPAAHGVHMRSEEDVGAAYWY
jgi:hypothetical protein